MTNIRTLDIPKRKTNVWTKVKEFFKKYWGYFVAFVGGIISVLFLNRKRNARTQSDIEELRNKLSEYTELVRETRRANSELATELERYNNNFRLLEDKLARSGEEANYIESVNREIGEQCKELGSSIEQLRKFIEQNGATS